MWFEARRNHDQGAVGSDDPPTLPPAQPGERAKGEREKKQRGEEGKRGRGEEGKGHKERGETKKGIRRKRKDFLTLSPRASPPPSLAT
jgi:hypothetical protein